MAPRLLIRVLCWLCLYSVHGQETPFGGNVTGPDFLVTNWNWTRQLNLTCQAPDALMVDRYSWFTPAYDTKRCDTNRSICTFQPRLEDDNQTVICRLTYLANPPTRAVYQVNLKYPPPSRPVVTTRSPQTHAVKQGDVITCTVTGGKPRVTNVTFHCQHPNHADREDDVSDNGRTVSSSVTVNIMVKTSQATEVNLTCTCSAYWDPEPDLYSHITGTVFIFSESSPGDNDPLSPAVIGGVIGAVVVAVAIVIIAIVMWKYCRRKQIHSRQNATVGENPQTTRQQQRERRPQQAEHVGIGNPYDVLQPGQDDGRTYTDLMTSSTADDGTYLHPANDDYDIPASK